MEDGSGYRVEILPALAGFPSGDLATDARRVTALFEERIRLAPHQYYWIHRRFKGRPEGYPDPYRR
jgi:KDO2-lipid IV(A) lauroyltransferase